MRNVEENNEVLADINLLGENVNSRNIIQNLYALKVKA
jgi:hypothetical protein